MYQVGCNKFPLGNHNQKLLAPLRWSWDLTSWIFSYLKLTWINQVGSNKDAGISSLGFGNAAWMNQLGSNEDAWINMLGSSKVAGIVQVGSESKMLGSFKWDLRKMLESIIYRQNWQKCWKCWNRRAGKRRCASITVLPPFCQHDQ